MFLDMLVQPGLPALKEIATLRERVGKLYFLCVEKWVFVQTVGWLALWVTWQSGISFLTASSMRCRLPITHPPVGQV